jgi:acetylornithine deacetylase/succinyl-diaminopimelate desuccinylase-like protein
MTGLADRVAQQMPQLTADLSRLVAIPSVSAVGYPPETHADLLAARDLVAELLESAGVQNVGSVDLPNTAPLVTGEIPAPPGAPTVLLYSHYDIVPPGDEEKWESPPFELTERDGALFGRGSADTKSNIVAHVGALRAWDGRPPVGIKIVIEGQEEVGGGALTEYPATNPELFRADAMLIADMGSVRPGVPTLTIGLRGMAQAELDVGTLGGPKHSGQYGGAAPDALTVLLHALTSLYDEHGGVAVEGLLREAWTGAGYTEEEFRSLAEVEPGVPLMGSGDLGSRIWSGPAITVTGIDVSSVEDALNAVNASARAKISIRVHPAQDAVEAQGAVVRHLEQVSPFGIAVTVTPGVTGNGFLAETTGPAYRAAQAAMRAAWGVEASYAASGGSIPLVNALHRAVPGSEILLLGTTDGYADIHAPNERVLIDELQKATLVEAEFFGRFAEQSA